MWLHCACVKGPSDSCLFQAVCRCMTILLQSSVTLSLHWLQMSVTLCILANCFIRAVVSPGHNIKKNNSIGLEWQETRGSTNLPAAFVHHSAWTEAEKSCQPQHVLFMEGRGWDSMQQGVSMPAWNIAGILTHCASDTVLLTVQVLPVQGLVVHRVITGTV